MMAGYRDTSSYEPFGQPNYGRPLRPYNWVQWTGVALAIFGVALDLAYFAGRLGWLPVQLGSPSLAMPPIFLGIALINSRREEITDPAPELATQRKRWLIITVAICAVILGAATAIEFARS